MKKIFSLGILFLTCHWSIGQITCTPDFTFEASSHNDQEIVFHNTSSITGAVAGVHHYYFEYRWGVASGNVGAGMYIPVGDPLRDVSHDYGTTGTWVVELSVEVREIATNNVVCTSVVTKNLSITSNNKCQADFSYSTPAATSTTANFTNTSSVNLNVPHTTHYEWDFSDGGTSTSVNPPHNFAARGHYPVNLQVYHVENSTQDTLLSHSVKKMVSVATIDTCNAAFAASPNASNYLQMDFTNLSYYETQKPYANLVEYDWNFGDGSTSTAENPSHTYAQDGNYPVELIITTLDSLQFPPDTLCFSTYTSTVNVSPATTPFCNAEFTLDTTNSGQGNVFIINTSTPASGNPAFITSYFWDFGDGVTSTQPFPVHVYNAPGAYQLCLSITSKDANGDYCTDTHCDTVGLDSTGALIYKSLTGFTLHVLDPNSVGQEEYNFDQVSLYPNPATDRLSIEGAAPGTRWYLYRIDGSLVAKGILNESYNSVDISDKEKGLYLMKFVNENKQSARKLSIQ